MKKLITRLLTLALSLIMVFGLVSCNKKKDPPPAPEMVSLKTIAENAIAGMLDSDYINIKLSGNIADKLADEWVDDEELPGTETQISEILINLKATENDFDAILKNKHTTSFVFDDQSISKIEHYSEDVIYKIGAEAVDGERYDKDDEFSYGEIYEPDAVTEVLEETPFTFDDFSFLGGAIVGALSEGKEVEKSSSGYTWTKSVDLAPKLNSLAKFIRDNAEKTVGEILMTLSGKTQAEIEAAIDAAFVAGLTVETAIPKLEKLLLDVTGETIVIKDIIDNFQSYTGISAKYLIDKINEIAKDDQLAEDPNATPVDVLPAPAEGQSIYDYILNYEIAEGQKIKDMSIDALVSSGEEGVTLASVVPMIKAMLFAPAADSEVEDMSLKFSDLLQSENDIAYILNSISALNFKKLSASVTISVGADGKLSGVGINFEIDIENYVDPADTEAEVVKVVNGTGVINVEITYTQPVDVVFAIPEEARVPEVA